jgi:putative addiction module component (TIGR02574 family)
MEAMSKLLEQAVARVRELPEEEQDAMAEALFAHLIGNQVHYRLTDEQVEEVERRLAEPAPRFLTLEEVRIHFRRTAG